MDLTQPRLLSVKYWHDKTVNTHGWWRMLPLVGLATAAVATGVFWLSNSLLTMINEYKDRQQEEAALDTLRAAVDSSYEQPKPDFTWLKATIKAGVRGLGESVDSEGDKSKRCTCVSGLSNRQDGQCEYHGIYY